MLAWAATPAGGVTLLIAATLLARVVLARAMGLGIDESYMAAIGRTAHLGYFDHPPVAWWLAWAAERVAGPGSDLGVRLPFILLFALSTWLMFRLAADLFGARAGLWAAVLMNAAPVLGVAAGSWVLPDGPLIAALLGATVCLRRALSQVRRTWGWWLGAGACFGLAACSKYTALPIGMGALIYLLTTPGGRAWLARPQPYLAGLVSLLLFAPVIAWNARNGWASLLFQGGRADGGHWYPFGPLAALGGEALFFLPWIWLPLAWCLWSAAQRGPADQRRWLLACLSLPSIILFALVALRARVLFHWAAPATMLALPLLGDWVARAVAVRRAVRVVLAATAIVVAVGVVLVGTEVRFNWLPNVVGDFAAGADPDLGAVDWTSLHDELARRGLLRPGVVVAAIRWHDAGKIDYALRGEVPVLCLGDDPREYGLSAPTAGYLGRDVLIVAPRETLAGVTVGFGARFDRVEALAPVPLLHAGRPVMSLPLFLGHRLRPPDDRGL